MRTIKTKGLLITLWAAALLPACGAGSEALTHPSVQAKPGSGDANKANSGKTSQSGATAQTSSDTTTSADTATSTDTATGSSTPATVPASKLGWDGTAFIGSKNLNDFPIE